MTTTLTNEEKLNIVNQHIKSIDYTIYGIELEKLQIQAVTPVETDALANINARLSAVNVKRNALLTEQESLTEPEA
jgi:hypothetical protein